MKVLVFVFALGALGLSMAPQFAHATSAHRAASIAAVFGIAVIAAGVWRVLRALAKRSRTQRRTSYTYPTRSR